MMTEERLKEIKDSIYIAHRINCDPAISMDFRDKEELYNEVVRLRKELRKKMEDDNNTASKLMNDEIKEILNFKENADYKRLSCDEIKVLRDYITNLQQENERLKDNIINELKKWAKAVQLTVLRSDNKPVYEHQDVLDKINELEERK